MKVIVTKNLNVRVGTPSVNAPCYNYLMPGSTIEVEEKLVQGDAFDGNSLWYKGMDGSYYWSGGVSSLPLHTSENKVLFSWFKEMGIQYIWDHYQEKGSDVCVAVLDTGYNSSNEELVIDEKDKKVFIDYPSAPLCNTIEDRVGHGTRCASLINAKNQKQYTIGIAPECRLLVGKISCRMELPNPNVILDGIEWAIQNGAEIISISFGCQFKDGAEQASYEQRLAALVSNQKVLLFASAGNNPNANGSAAFGENYPASFPQCISVGATSHGVFDTVTLQSTQTILHAPGRAIESYDLSGAPVPDTGTSFSTPIAAAVVALAVSYSKKHQGGNWDPKTILSHLYASASPLTGSKKFLNPVQLFDHLSKNPIT